MFKKILLLSLFTSSLFGFDIEKINTFEADFSQSIINQSGKEITYTGKIFIKKPMNVLWKYGEPTNKDVYLINNNVTIIEPELEQAIFSSLKNEINILKLLENAEKIEPNKYESTIYNKPYIFTVQEDKLTTIEYKDNVDNKVIISFHNILQNHVISEKTFTFTIPPYFDIIRK